MRRRDTRHPGRQTPASHGRTRPGRPRRETACAWQTASAPGTAATRHGRIGSMLRWLTAGESHGRALVAVCEGVPAGVEVTTDDIAQALARRRAGYGRGARMKFEQD